MSTTDFPDFALAVITDPDGVEHDADFLVLEDLSPDEYEMYSSAYAKLEGAFNDSLVEYLYFTLVDAEQLTTRIASAVLTTDRSLSVTERERVTRRVVASVLNFVSAVYMFEEHIQVRAVGETKDRKLRDEIRKRFQDLCANDPWVGLLLAVRHAAVHQTTAIISLAMRTEEASDGVVSFCHPVVSRRVLDGLKGVIDPGSTVEEFLDLHKQDPDLLTLMSDTFDSLEQFYRDIAPMIEANLVEPALVLRTLRDRFPSDVGDNRVLLAPELSREDDGRVHGTLGYVPLLPWVFDYAENLLDGEYALPPRPWTDADGRDGERPADPGTAAVYFEKA